MWHNSNQQGDRRSPTRRREAKMTKWKNASARATVTAIMPGRYEVSVNGPEGHASKTFERNSDANNWLRERGFKCWNAFTKKWM